MAKYTTVTVWVLVDHAGDYVALDNQEDIAARYEENFGELNAVDGYRMVRLNVRVPLPEVITLECDATEGDDNDQGAAVSIGQGERGRTLEGEAGPITATLNGRAG